MTLQSVRLFLKALLTSFFHPLDQFTLLTNHLLTFTNKCLNIYLLKFQLEAIQILDSTEMGSPSTVILEWILTEYYAMTKLKWSVTHGSGFAQHTASPVSNID